MRRLPVVLAVAVAGLLAWGLLSVLWKNLEVAPWAGTGERGRLHYHTKNITRLPGSAAEVRRAVERAVYLDAAPARPEIHDWRDAIRHELRPGLRPQHVVALPGEGRDAPVWALPGAYWAVWSGNPVIFLGKDNAGSEASGLVRRLDLPVYVLAPRELVSDRVVDQLGAWNGGRVRRVAGDDPASHAVLLAETRNPDTGFGWGRSHEARTGYFHFVVAAPADAAQALAALPLARSNAATLLYAGDGGGIPGATDRYIWSQRADWFVTPAEGPFRHLWLVGDRVSYAAQGRLDLAPEKAPYLSMGPAALGPMEGVAVVFLALGLAGALFVLVHGARLLPWVMLPTRLAWVFTALLVPVLGVLLYVSAYRRPRINPDEPPGGHPRWMRPPSIQAAAATAMGFGYGAPLMIAVGYLFVSLGFPLFFGEWADDWTFVFGAGMPLMMTGMYVFAVLLAWPLVQVPMKRMMSHASARRVAWSALKITALSMAAVSLGMMTTSWWMLMEHSPMMPGDDEILWFGSLWLASTIGFLVAWPLNWPMVRAHLKPGTM